MKGWLYVLLIETAMRCWDLGDWLEERATELGGKVIQGPWTQEQLDEVRESFQEQHDQGAVLEVIEMRPYLGSVNPDAKIIPFPRRAS